MCDYVTVRVSPLYSSHAGGEITCVEADTQASSLCHCRFEERLLTAGEVAERTVTGVLRNERYVYIPRIVGLVGLRE